MVLKNAFEDLESVLAVERSLAVKDFVCTHHLLELSKESHSLRLIDWHRAEWVQNWVLGLSQSRGLVRHCREAVSRSSWHV